MTGPANTGKTGAIRRFTGEHLEYEKAGGDVRGVFQMPFRHYAVGVNSYGDNAEVVQEGLDFIDRYRGLRVILLASRSQGETFERVETFARARRTTVHRIWTARIEGDRAQAAAIRANVEGIMNLMPGRGR